ncbi:MAG: vitamin B12 dependent-methionine synthase activation domain-containing protein [Bacteroidaceae bacterium]
MKINYRIHELTEYINWIYFFHAWGFQPRFAAIADLHGCDACRAGWLANFPQEERMKATEAMQLFKEANRMLNELDPDFEAQALFRLMDANSKEDNLILDGTVFPLLRQQSAHKEGEPFLCLSDFVRPLSSGIKDRVGAFAASFDAESENLYQNDSYKHLLVQTLSSRLAEAAVEKMHEYIRKEAWGYAKEEQLTMKEMLIEKYQGIRPAVGYPSLPDQSINFLLDELLDMKQIGIRLTDNGAMNPHASVSGLIIANPSARYFAIGNIGEDQLIDYSQRRGMEAAVMEKFLAANRRTTHPLGASSL